MDIQSMVSEALGVTRRPTEEGTSRAGSGASQAEEESEAVAGAASPSGSQ